MNCIGSKIKYTLTKQFYKTNLPTLTFGLTSSVGAFEVDSNTGVGTVSGNDIPVHTDRPEVLSVTFAPALVLDGDP